jgi:hypothetical protein
MERAPASRVELQTEATKIAEPHDGGLTSNLGESVDVIVISDSTGGHDGDATRAHLFVQREVGSAHRPVSFDGGDVQTHDTGVEAARQCVVDVQSAHRGPTPDGDATVGDVQCHE